MVKAIVFDFWGTLMENGIFPSPTRQAKYFLRIDNLTFQEYVITFEEALMLKKFDNLADAFMNVCKAFDIKPPHYIIEKLVGVWNKNRLLAKPFPEVIEVLNELKKKYKLVLLSNSDCFSVEPLIEKYEMKKLFEGLFFSYETGMLKTNPAVFDKITEKLGIGKEELVVVGDSIDSDIKGAEQAGVRAILIDRKGRRDYKEKISNLEELKDKL